MFHRLAVSSLALVGLLTVAAAPVQAGQSTGTWRYFNPSMAHVAPPFWRHQPYGGGYARRGYGHWEHQGHRRGHGGYAPLPHGHAYGGHPGPAW